MKIDDAHEGQHVRVIDKPSSCDQFYAGRTGMIIQIWESPEYKWHDWATIEFDGEMNGQLAHIKWKNLEPLEEQPS